MPPDEPPFLEEDYQRLPPGVELRPDGAMVQHGVVVGRLAADTPQRRKMRRVREFATQWTPERLYVDDWRLLTFYKLRDTATLSASARRITGLCATPAGDVAVYAVTDAADSTGILCKREEYGRGPRARAVLRGSDIASDAWFHQPMFLSADKRWLLAAVSGGRAQTMAGWDDRADGAAANSMAEPSELWLVDCSGLLPPRRLLSKAHVLSCSWTPDGRRAAFAVAETGAGNTRAGAVYVLEAEAGSVSHVADALGWVFWSMDGESVRIYPSEGRRGEVVICDLCGGEPNRVTEGGEWPLGDQVVWSAGGTKWASLERVGAGCRVRIVARPGHGRTAPLQAGLCHLLGWSSEGQLLAYIASDQTLRFSSGVVTEAEYERLMGAIPLAAHEPQGITERPGQSAREEVGLDTTASPVKVNTAAPVLSAWAQTNDGPCFLYTDTDDTGQRLKVLRFVSLSLAELGINPRGDLAAQIAQQRTENSAYQFAKALADYARKHRKLPEHPGGLGLEEDLKPHLLSSLALRSGDAPDRVCARLLLPGISVDLLEQSMAKGEKVKVAELRSAEMVFGVYAQPPQASSLEEDLGLVEPLPVSFTWSLEQGPLRVSS